LTTFRRRGRIDRSRLSQRRIESTDEPWIDALGDGIDYEVEELHPAKPRLRSKGIYLLPNAFTTAALFCGFFAIVNAMNHQFETAAIAIFASLVLDGMDGRVARMTNTQSAFGEQYDSLADMVSFGVAPAIIMFKLLWDALQQEKNALDVHMLGMAPAFLIACFAALRLAKFNITADGQKQYFIGMPTPAVGLFIGCFPILVWYNENIITSQLHNKWVLYGIIALVCWLMVSNIKFFKFIPSSLKLSHIWPQIILIIAGIIGAVFIQFSIIPILFLLYILLSIVYRHPSTTITS